MESMLDLLMIGALMAAILSGFPVAFSIAGVAILFALIGWQTGAMNIALLGALAQRVFGLISNQVLIAIPLFVFMGAILEKSRIAEELLETMAKAFGRLQGGLGVSVVIVGALLAASTGIVGATVVAMGMIALPTMLRANYNPALASGIVCTAGTLGQIIPPSTLLIIMADVMSNSYQQAQYAQGKFSIEALSVGQVFSAALIPGLSMVVLYIIYILIRAKLRPQDAPADTSNTTPLRTSEIWAAILPPIALIIAVLGAILSGVASPTEAAAVGAVGAVLLSAIKKPNPSKLIILGALCLIVLVIISGIYPIRLQRDDLSLFQQATGGAYGIMALFGLLALALAIGLCYKGGELVAALESSMTMTSMIFATMIAASMFSLVFIGLGGEERVEYWLSNMPGGATGALIFSMLIIFVLGFFLDFVEISVIALPLLVPGLIVMGHDPIWLSVLIAINLQTSFLTPPFGFSLFYLRGAAPKEITTGQIYRGVVPFIGLQIVAVTLIWNFPTLATWLPSVLF